MNSQAFASLKTAIRKAKLICNRVPLSTASQPLHDLKVKSLILLSHAAFEEYFEDLALEIAEASLKSLKDDGILSGPAFSLISYHRNSFASLTDYPVRAGSLRDQLVIVAENALDAHEKAVEDNHGIKAKNQDRTLLPVGVNTARIDSTLRNALDSFGQKRGGVAHSAGITTVYTRSAIESDIKNLLLMIEPFDITVLNLCSDHFEVFA